MPLRGTVRVAHHEFALTGEAWVFSDANPSVATPSRLTPFAARATVARMNATHVNARIAELMEQDRFWAEPETLAEAIAMWGTGANEHGVFCQHERIE